MTQETIGILALQGNVAEHGYVLDQLGVPHRKVRLPRDLEGLSGLILPGGESTTASKRLEWPMKAATKGEAGAS